MNAPFHSTAFAAMLIALAGTIVPTANAEKESQPEAPPEVREREPRGTNGRRVTNGKMTTLAFDNVTIERMIPFIVEATGKVVLPRAEILNRRVTVINDREIPQSYAVDLVFFALQQEGIGVVETEDLIILRDIAEIDRQDVPVIGPNESTLGRTDFGSIAEKVYRLNNATAENLEDVLEDAVPDYATIAFDPESNQIIVRGNISLLQRMERLITSLDRPSSDSLQTATFRLRFADAEQIAENIRELYEDTENEVNRQIASRFRGGGRGGGGDDSEASTSENLRVTANTQQNAVTVLAEPGVIDQIRRQVENEWDLPLPEEAVVPKVYTLQNSDPVRVVQALEGLFGQSSQSGNDSETQGAGRLQGQFSFQALAEAGRVAVVAKSPDNLAIIDAIIKDLDSPQTVGLPEIVELKHADAEELAEQLNALLAQTGSLAQIPRQERGLSDSSNASPFADGGTDGADATANQTEFITFWWQRANTPTDSSEASNLVGQLRIVPVWRQNAVMILSPPEYRASVRELVGQLDKPGRQVLISAVIAEVTLEDALSLGLRWSSNDILTSGDNSLSIGTSTTAQENDLLGNLFDTSVLDVNANLNVVLQALDEDQNVNILSEPRIFTSDNQEAEFFDGQDVPIVDTVQITDNGSRNTTRQYQAVGIQLRARPRITQSGNVDLRVNLELSSIAPGQVVDDFVIIDRRETTTQLVVQDGQTVVISGILRSEDSDVVRKVPLLGDIPLIGALFTSIEENTTNTELIAFITPVIVDNDNIDEVNRGDLERLQQIRDRIEGVKPSDDKGSE